MSCFVKMPYLPTASVTHILGGAGLRSYEKALSDLKVTCVYSEPIPSIKSSVKSHIDLAVFPFGGKDFILEPSQTQLFDKLISLGAHPQYVNEPIKNGYPWEAKLNCVRIGNRLFGNLETVSEKILKQCEKLSLSVCAVKQGYTKCSVAVVAKDALITDDAGIAHTAKMDNMDVLLVEKGSVCLNGYPYGFIGGCCSLLSKDILLFMGNWKTHTNAEAIFGFLRNYQIYPESLANSDLTDIGSFIPLLQQEEE